MASRMRGRDREIGVVGARLQLLRQGRGSVTLVAGDAGSGKSRMLQEGLTVARRLGARTGVGVAQRGDRVVPLHPLVGALFGGAEPLLRPMRAEVPPGRWAVGELESHLETAARDVPLAIAVDDIHWADTGTVATVGTLAGRLHDLPIAWMVTFRERELTDEARQIVLALEDSGAARLDLGQLDDAAIAAIVADQLGAPPDRGLLELATSAGGTVFWLTELLHGLSEDGLLSVRDGVATLSDVRLPARMRDTMAQRLARMPEISWEIATAASVLGPTFSVDALAQMLARSTDDLSGPVDDLVRAELLGADGDLLAFRHDILREAVLGTVPDFALAALQRQGADVRLAHGARPEQVAEQLAASAQPGDAGAIDVLTEASAAIAESAPATAAELNRVVLQLIAPDDPRRARLLADTALLLHAAGRVQEGRDFAETALRGSLSVAEESEVRYGIAGMFRLSADTRSEAGRAALALPDLDAADRRRHLVRLIDNTLSAGRIDEARAIIAQHAGQIRDGEDPSEVLSLELAQAGLRYIEGDFSGCVGAIDAALERVPAAAAIQPLRDQPPWREDALFALDRYEDALRTALAQRGAARAAGDTRAFRAWEQTRGRHLRQFGDLSDAIAVLEGQLFGVGHVASALGPGGASALAALASAALSVGDRRLMARCADVARSLLDDGTPEEHRHARWILAEQAMAFGDPDTAHATLGVNVEGGPILPLLPTDVAAEPHLVRLALAGGDEPLARRAVRAAQARSDANAGTATIAGATAHARGLLERDGDLLDLAIAAYEGGRRRPALASALEDAGALAADAHRLDRALALYVEMGAGWDATRVRSRLRRLGVRRRQVGPDRPTTGWEALTDSELSVMQLVADGMTNREVADHLFVSPNTVSSHLRRVFAKLGVNSRTELASLVRQRHPDA